MKFLRTYESYKLNNRFKFEEEVIDPILILIRDNQEYLTKLENLPQLAKLGYMYNTLWYAGRICWGSDGILLDPEIKKDIKNYKYGQEEPSPYEWTSCEDNPKYKIEMCDPMNSEIGDLIYDAWGYHVIDERESPNYDKFSRIVKEGSPITDLEKKEIKINKTFEEWVEVMTHPQKKYRSTSKRSVANTLLCVIGSGFDWDKEGFIIETASGADQDKAIYGDWKNAKFSPEIEKEAFRIVDMIEVRETVNSSHKYLDDITKAEKLKKDQDNKKWNDELDDMIRKYTDNVDSDILKIIKRNSNGDDIPTEKKYSKYYPISTTSNIYPIMDKESKERLGLQNIHQSYIDASIDISKEIIEHESEEDESNVEFAKKLLTNLNISDYSHELDREVDKYKIEEELVDILLPITDDFQKVQDIKNEYEYTFYLNDTKLNAYADNSFHFNISLKGLNVPKGYYKNLDPLKSTPFYNDLLGSLNRIGDIDEICHINIGIDNDDSLNLLSMSFLTSKKYAKWDKIRDKQDSELISQGFFVGKSKAGLEIGDMIFTCRKPSGQSNSLTISIRDKSWNKIHEFDIDERGYNTINTSNITNEKLTSWINNEFITMKQSDPSYGTYGMVSNGREGNKRLYAQDFFLWLKKNETNYKK